MSDRILETKESVSITCKFYNEAAQSIALFIRSNNTDGRWLTAKGFEILIVHHYRRTSRNESDGWRENGRRNKGGSGGEGARFFNWALLRKRRRAKERRRKERGGVGAGDEARKKEERGGSHRALLLIPRNGSINEMAGQTKPNAIARNTRSSWAPAPCVSLERSTTSLAVPAP